MAIIQSVGRAMKSLFCLLHFTLVVSVLANKVELDSIYIRLALFSYPVVMSERVLKNVQMTLNLLFRLMFWFLWAILLAGRQDLGCGYLRLALLALPFFKSKIPIKTVLKAVKQIWKLLVWLIKRMMYLLSLVVCILWMVLTSLIPMPSILLLVQITLIFMQSAFALLPWILWMHMLMDGYEVPLLLCEAVYQILKTALKHAWLLRSAVKATTVEDYLDAGHPSTMIHDTLHFRICSEDGQKLWKGFIDVVLDAYEKGHSWAGNFSSDHLRIHGSKCIIEMEANEPANYQNLLLDLAKMASLLIPHFETLNQLAPFYIQQLYSSMTAPHLALNPPPTPQQLQRFVRFMRNHPALTSARKTNIFLRKVFEATQGMGLAGSAAVHAAVNQVTILGVDWTSVVIGSGHRLLNRTLFYRTDAQNNHGYGVGALPAFRFIRNFLTHGADRDANGQQTVNDMEELDLIIAEFFSQPITELVYHLVMNIEMTGLLHHAWMEYL